jgi:DNA topoisomerase-1
VTHGLIYVSDTDPGISRKRRGRGFSYLGPDGTTFAQGVERARIEALAVLPAYEVVWICTGKDGHLQATGRDARRRKQYRYHPDWSAVQASTKYDQLADFGDILPAIRRRVDRDLATDPGDAEFALAGAAMIIDRASLRIGNPDYSRKNGSYGALTLRRLNLFLSNDNMDLCFKAKGGKKVRKVIIVGKLQKLLDKVNDIPGATLLTWLDDEAAVHTLSSHQLNAHISDAAGNDLATAKTFRTWAGTIAAFECAEAGGTTVKEIASAASARLHNTPTVARNSYIHPDVIKLAGADPVAVDAVKRSGLFAAEKRLLGFLTTR